MSGTVYSRLDRFEGPRSGPKKEFCSLYLQEFDINICYPEKKIAKIGFYEITHEQIDTHIV